MNKNLVGEIKNTQAHLITSIMRLFKYQLTFYIFINLAPFDHLFQYLFLKSVFKLKNKNIFFFMYFIRIRLFVKWSLIKKKKKKIG